MPVSQETALRSEVPLDTPVYDRAAYISEPDSYNHDGKGIEAVPSSIPDSDLPSSSVHPTVVQEAPQQAATQPGSGTAVLIPTAIIEEKHHPSFKEKVIGYAKKTKGMTLGKPELKEQGERILAGDEVFEPEKDVLVKDRSCSGPGP